jgi:hypothetical protein
VSNTVLEYKDFSRPKRQVKFTVGGYEYEAMSAIPLGLALDMAKVARTFKAVDEDSRLDGLWQFFDAALMGDGGKQIQKQAYDKTDPLDTNQLVSIMNWLLEVYGLRPTEPSSNSSTGSSESGTSSTDGVQAEDSTPSISTSSAS